MDRATYVQNNIIQAILDVCDKEADTLVRQIQQDYVSINNVKGKADVTKQLKQYAKDQIVMSIISAGQKAVIAEYGKGSLMDRDNPALEDYFNEKGVFNQRRLAYDMAIITRPYDKSYKDLDGNTFTRKPPTREYNLEETGDKRYQPVSPKYIVKKALEQRINLILDRIAEAIAVESKIEKMFDDLEFTVKL